MTAFPDRPSEFFDHTHNLVLNFAVEMGLPLAAIVLALLVYALWQALRNAIAEGRASTTSYPVQRAAFVIVFLVAVHSMLEYPLWYAYFLLPTAFAFGLCLERPTESAGAARAVRDAEAKVTRPYVLAAMFLMLGGTLAVYDYMRVVVIFAPPAGAGPLEQRIAAGRKSILFGHHADYAMATIAAHPGDGDGGVRPRAALPARQPPDGGVGTRPRRARRDRQGALDRRPPARVPQRERRGILRRLRRTARRAGRARKRRSRGLLMPRARRPMPRARPAGAASAPPFQCRPAERTYRFEDFR